MKKILINITACLLMLALLPGISSCKKEFDNPNAATTDQALSSSRGLMAVAIGVQRLYTLNVQYGLSDATGLITGETFLLNPGNLSEAQFSSGGNAVDNTNALLGNVWATSSKCIYDANNVITGAEGLADKAYASGLIGYATIIKSLAIGAQSMYWENVPDTIGTTATGFISRENGFNKAIAAIDKALALISANPISAAFTTDMPAGINDIPNTLLALKARYLLFVGKYAEALTAANAVNVSKVSNFNFDAATPNPIYNIVASTNNVYQPVDSTLGLPLSIRPALTDARIAFYTSINASIAPRFRLKGFWDAANKSIPIYIPDEVKLIRAECLLRQSAPDAAAAKTIIDEVLKQTPAADPLGVGANIADGYTGDTDAASLLTEVYRNRCIELYLSGLKLEDMRRFGRPVSERKRNFFPYPIAERNNNTNTPADPAF
ncbi:MAG: hypothetical protein RL172_1923 [Bacteroidota bacterium]